MSEENNTVDLDQQTTQPGTTDITSLGGLNAESVQHEEPVVDSIEEAETLLGVAETVESVPVDPVAPITEIPPMPIMTKWKCHKEVQAEFIEDIVQVGNEIYQVIPKQPTKLKLPIYVTNEWLEKHNPEKGGVIVKYADGYLSYSPRDAFRAGYTKL